MLFCSLRCASNVITSLIIKGRVCFTQEINKKNASGFGSLVLLKTAFIRGNSFSGKQGKSVFYSAVAAVCLLKGDLLLV